MLEKLKKNVLLLSVFLGVFAVLMIFCPAITIDWNMGTYEFPVSIDGLKAVFGWEVETARGVPTGDMDILEFSVFGLLPYVAAAVAVVMVLQMQESENKEMFYIAIVLFAVAALLFFLNTHLIRFEEEEFKEMIEDEIHLGAGSILGGICSALASLCVWMHLDGTKPAAKEPDVREKEKVQKIVVGTNGNVETTIVRIGKNIETPVQEENIEEPIEEEVSEEDLVEDEFVEEDYDD